MAPAKPTEKQKPPITWLQIWSAAFSAASCVMIGMILNIVWDMKEWKGVKDQVDIRQDAELVLLRIDVSANKKKNEEQSDILVRWEAIMDERKDKKQK
jgi:hypothetical protein